MITADMLRDLTSTIGVVLGVVTALTAAAALTVNAVVNLIRIAVALSSRASLWVAFGCSAAGVAFLMMALGIRFWESVELFGLYGLTVPSVFIGAAGVQQLNKIAIRTNDARKSETVADLLASGQTQRLQGAGDEMGRST